ncbi:MAG: TldD/PmbA family protein [Erysipelotrichaceae bacterium]|nr:TldD/PmbA family protein [Erysipelotrichaceae bacterium]
MDYNVLFLKAKELNIEALELYEATTKEIEVSLFEGEVDDYNSSDVKGLAIRGIYQGKEGNTFIEKFSDDLGDEILQRIISSSLTIENDDEVLFNQTMGNYEQLQTYFPQLENIATQDIISLLKALEKTVLDLDPRIKQVMSSNFAIAQKEIRIFNSYGLSLERKNNYAILSTSLMVGEQEDTKTGFDYQVKFSIDEFSVEQIAKKAVAKAVSMLHATTVKSGKYNVLVKNEAMIGILGSLIPSLNGDLVNKGLSKYKDSLNKKVLNQDLTIIDNPHLEKGIGSTPFDDEGTPTSKKAVIENGVINTFLHNLKTGKKSKSQSTGNGFKSGYKSEVGIRPTNFYIEPKEASFQDLLEKTGCGIMIENIQGLHSGMNTLTGDFSLQCSGHIIENGKISAPVNLILLSGNLFKLFDEQLVAIGSDLHFSYSGIGSSSILFKDCLISGN